MVAPKSGNGHNLNDTLTHPDRQLTDSRQIGNVRVRSHDTGTTNKVSQENRNTVMPTRRRQSDHIYTTVMFGILKANSNDDTI